MSKISLLLLLVFFAGCTLQKDKEGQDNAKLRANSLSPQSDDPTKPLLTVNLSIPAGLKEKPRNHDLLIWTLLGEEGVVLSGGVEPLPAFPWQRVVQVKDLIQPVSRDSRLVFSARIVHLGEESMAPKKGQLEVMLGSLSSEPEVAVGKAGVSIKILERIENKLATRIKAARELKIGDSIDGVFEVSTF